MREAWRRRKTDPKVAEWRPKSRPTEGPQYPDRLAHGADPATRLNAKARPVSIQTESTQPRRGRSKWVVLRADAPQQGWDCHPAPSGCPRRQEAGRSEKYGCKPETGQETQIAI